MRTFSKTVGFTYYYPKLIWKRQFGQDRDCV